MKVILLIGACGSGKTWVMKELIRKLKLNTLGRVGMFLFHRDVKFLVLGKYDGTTFEGSDKLSMAVMRDLGMFKAAHKDKTVICEGDRFTNRTFVEGVKPTIVVINNDGSEGRKKRQSNQTERQIKSIQSRVNNFVEEFKPKYTVKSSVEALKLITTKLI